MKKLITVAIALFLVLGLMLCALPVYADDGGEGASVDGGQADGTSAGGTNAVQAALAAEETAPPKDTNSVQEAVAAEEPAVEETVAEEAAPADEAAPVVEDPAPVVEDPAPADDCAPGDDADPTIGGDCFLAFITPDTAEAGQTQTYTLIIINVSRDFAFPAGTIIGEGWIQVPGEFSVPILGAVDSGPLTGVWEGDWSAVYSAPWIVLYLSPPPGDNYQDTLISTNSFDPDGPGPLPAAPLDEYVQITFDATAPEAEGVYQFTTWAELWSGSWMGNGGFLYEGGAAGPWDSICSLQPTVTVYGRPFAGSGLPTGTGFDWFGNPVFILVDTMGRTQGPVEVDGLSPDDPILLLDPFTTIGGPGGLIPGHIQGIPGGTPPPPAGTTMIADYQFLPSGITFDPAARVVINYDPATVPEGKVLVIAYYDTAISQWVEVETAGYVAADGTPVPDAVTCDVSHFTYFALLAK
jgi:hypothetical protein